MDQLLANFLSVKNLLFFSAVQASFLIIAGVAVLCYHFHSECRRGLGLPHHPLVHLQRLLEPLVDQRAQEARPDTA